MKIVEFTQIKVTYPRKPRERAAGVWNLETNKHLREAIEKCLKTHRTVFHPVPGGVLYRVRPTYPLIERAMKDPRYKNVLKLSVTLFTPAWGVGVEAEPKDGLLPAVPNPESKKAAPRATKKAGQAGKTAQAKD